ncbi:hypothetical protein HG536_0B02610 [Torulaspora globosa]|uniref:Biogenesis of lysosome-related organelles complex 1 subunit SNN1 n=1 Tax=Torulaspora globosa TaxID=48254 RepID=A0A7G3ZD12_9SACH|nr:uncharacterized protein HG536_0B02610 [Torulaspora globosa]QLL31398.1 hypothetical protein HG536_0B02610 [Torulaspora globosa]
MQSNPEDTEGSGIHAVELCVYSILSTDLDGIYQSINQLRESQALLVLLLRRCRNSLKCESELLYDKEDIAKSALKVRELEKRLNKVTKRLNEIKLRGERLVNRY